MYRIRRYKTVCAVAFAFVVGLFFANEYPFRGALFQQKILLGNPDHKGHERKWWKEAVVYEIYPASFKDSNDDGIGDIPGIISKLDYLQDLGVDVIAICPHYQSPQVDMGYDVSDYNEIHRTFGTLEDVQKLINATHARGMRIIFDLVINHSSNLHKFFRESRSSKNNPKRDWYYWRPAKYDKAGNRHPPSNWRSHFTGPAWTWDEATQEYYLHVYAPEMPDFNWESEECRRAIYETAIIFWLDRGLDGFRIDTVNKYSKNISFPDAEIVDPDAETQPASKFYNNGPRIHEFIGEMREIFDRYDAMSVGELSHFPRIESEVMKFVSAKANQLNMVFNFELVSFGEERKNRKGLAPFFVTTFARELSKWQYFVGGTDGWTTLFLENHDHTRSISRFGSDSIDSIPEYRVRSGKMLAVLLATMTGTLFLYQGQEIGMTNAPSSWPMSEYKDVRSINRWHKAQQQCGSDAECLTLASQAIRSDARDHARLPMQWGSGENAGFTSVGVMPWMRINDNWKEVNVETQVGDQQSILEFWRKILKLRKEYKDVFIYGHYEFINSDDLQLFVFTKEAGGMKSLTVLNMTPNKRKWAMMPKDLGSHYTLLVGNVEHVSASEEDLLLPWEGRVYISI